jgi:hypothetical protein
MRCVNNFLIYFDSCIYRLVSVVFIAFIIRQYKIWDEV